MRLQCKNEILRLLKNIKLSGFLNYSKLCKDDVNADIVLSSLYMLIKRYDFPIHYDEKSDGCFVPDIVTYQCPPIYFPKTKMDYNDIMNYENSMEQHIIGIEHFKIGNFSYINAKRKIVNKLSSYESNLYKLENDIIEQINDLATFKVKGQQDIFISFDNIYKKHFSKMDVYERKIQEDNLLGHAIHPDKSKHYIPIWFLIECDDCMFIDSNQQEVPIFLTETGKAMIKEIGIPDGLIYYGRTGISAYSRDTLNRIPFIKNTYLMSPQKEQYLKFQNDEWGKTIHNYIKIV